MDFSQIYSLVMHDTSPILELKVTLQIFVKEVDFFPSFMTALLEKAFATQLLNTFCEVFEIVKNWFREVSCLFVTRKIQQIHENLVSWKITHYKDVKKISCKNMLFGCKVLNMVDSFSLSSNHFLWYSKMHISIYIFGKGNI